MNNIITRILRRLLKKKDKEELSIIKKENIQSLNYAHSNVEDYNSTDKKFLNKINNLSGIILDGPHGNGRSFAFPIFYKSITKNKKWVIIKILDKLYK